MTVREIVEAYLKEHGFDGLYHDNDCGCRIGDLMPCTAESVEYCKPGYKIKCTPETCENGGGCDCHIGPKGTVTPVTDKLGRPVTRIVRKEE